jgi:hypothetical protein
MKKINIKKTVENDPESVRTASKYYSVYFPGQKSIYIFKNKKKLAAFMVELQKEVDKYIIMINQITADLYVIFRQNWMIFRDGYMAGNFLEIDKLLNRLYFSQQTVFYVQNDIIRLSNLLLNVVESLRKSSLKNKNYALSKYLAAFSTRVGDLSANVLNFGKSGKWAAYGQPHTPKKLY